MPRMESRLDSIRIKPFLKWAGGKRWLVDKHSDLLDVEFDRYIEPFLGSGAVFFSLAPCSSILCDKNEELIEAYSAIKNDWQLVFAYLKKHNSNHSKEYYYKIRSAKFRTPHTRAARFLYLNRTCWNGLYRVNLKGEFNVPMGTKTKVVMDDDDFEKVSENLANSELLAGDFELALEKAGAGDFVFVDPPYTIKHNYNGFVKYNESIFSWQDQERLRDLVSEATTRGAKVIVTNASHDSIRDLYYNIGEITTLNRASVISGKANARGTYDEVVIRCF